VQHSAVEVYSQKTNEKAGPGLLDKLVLIRNIRWMGQNPGKPTREVIEKGAKCISA